MEKNDHGNMIKQGFLFDNSSLFIVKVTWEVYTHPLPLRFFSPPPPPPPPPPPFFAPGGGGPLRVFLTGPAKAFFLM
jgi:hypothetical protein